MTCEPNRWTPRFGRLAGAGVVAAMLVAGCGGSDSGTTKPETAASSAVTVKQFQFMPAELTVKAGARVTWANQDDIVHTATSGATPGTADGTFDGPMDGPGKSVSHVFDQAGRFPYFCSRHTSMTGTVVVEEPDPSLPPTQQLPPARPTLSGRAGGAVQTGLVRTPEEIAEYSLELAKRATDELAEYIGPLPVGSDEEPMARLDSPQARRG